LTVSASTEFERFGGVCALLTGLLSLLYSITFVFLTKLAPSAGAISSSIFLTAGGLISTGALVAIYERLTLFENNSTITRQNPSTRAFALWALLLSIFGAFGFVIFGGYTLTVSLHPASATGLANQADPSGLLSFGISGLALIIISWLILRTGTFPRSFGLLGFVLGVLLVWFYTGRLLIASLASPVVLVPGVLSGLIVQPAWYLWLGYILIKSTKK